MRASISNVPGYNPVGQPTKESRNRCGSTASPNSEITPAANSGASICPVSNWRTGTDSSQRRQSSSALILLPSHSRMTSTPPSSTSTPPTSNSKTRMSVVEELVFIVAVAQLVPDRKSTPPNSSHLG